MFCVPAMKGHELGLQFRHGEPEMMDIFVERGSDVGSAGSWAG